MFLRVAQSDLRAKKSFFVVISARNATGHIVHQRTYKFSIAQYPETHIFATRPASAVEISRRRRNNFPFLHVPRALIFNKTERGSGVPSHFLDFRAEHISRIRYARCLAGRSCSPKSTETGTLVRQMKSREYEIKKTSILLRVKKNPSLLQNKYILIHAIICMQDAS